MCRSGAHGALVEVRAVHGVLRELVDEDMVNISGARQMGEI
jgi:hypothetical protein